MSVVLTLSSMRLGSSSGARMLQVVLITGS